MTDHPVLRARTTPATAPVPASEADAQLDVQLKRAHAIAGAKQAVPQSYRANPGAVLLAMDWAQSRGMDLLTAIQTVAFIDGKPVIDASMQRALAKRAGYTVSIPEASPERATVQIADRESGEVLGSATYSMEDAKRAGLANKKNWQNNPEDMVVARATTRAMRRFAPDVMVGLVAGEDELDEIAPDPVGVLGQSVGGGDDSRAVDVAPNPVGESEEPPVASDGAGSDPSPTDDEPVEAEVVEDGPITDATREAVSRAIGEAKASGEFKERGMALQEAGIPLPAQRMTEAEGVRALAILGGAES